MRATMIDAGLDEVQITIEQQAQRLQQAGMAIAQANAVLTAIPTNAQALIAAVNTEGTAEQKTRLAAYTQDFQAVQGVAAAATARAEVAALRNLEV